MTTLEISARIRHSLSRSNQVFIRLFYASVSLPCIELLGLPPLSCVRAMRPLAAFAVPSVMYFAVLATPALGGGFPDSNDEELLGRQQRVASGASFAHDGHSLQTGHADNASSLDLRPSVVQENSPPEAKKPENTFEKGVGGADVRVVEENAEDEGSRPRRSLGTREKARRAALRNAAIVGLAVLAVAGIGFAGFKVAPRSGDPVN